MPTAANAGYYAQIVAERADPAATRDGRDPHRPDGLRHRGGAGGIVGSVDDVVDRAQAEIYDVTERRTSEDYVHIESLLQATLDEIDTHLGHGRNWDRDSDRASAAWTRSPTVCTPDR